MAEIHESTTGKLVCPHCKKEQISKNWTDGKISGHVSIKYCDFCGYKFYWHNGMWSSVYSWWDTGEKREKRHTI